MHHTTLTSLFSSVLLLGGLAAAVPLANNANEAPVFITTTKVITSVVTLDPPKPTTTTTLSTVTPTKPCTTDVTVCWDGINECGMMYGGCFPDCRPWPTFTPPPCPTSKPSVITSVTTLPILTVPHH
ncbi:hypothetical protein C7999DRAFT_27473 [Corynascus novoguineensis]|uniref:Uncharacterized protein n=1 Tax=Corynascus novoguineensis TaxID=1126955 RepID=A0AAN7HV01_9PEZI|nr:hypothetical protein C7999DRAFT_27473 [Corynascus novoguineensis]